jgi:ubiquinone/menaquinone biosynthesis C-methylase UbiE
VNEEERQTALDEIARTYDRYATSGYGLRWRASRPGQVRDIAERDRWACEALKSKPVVVEIGCGDGNLALALDRAGLRPARYVGLDILEPRLAVARERIPWGEFRREAADAVSEPAASVDAVAAMTLLSSLPQAMRAGVYAEVRRLLRPGGVFVVYDLRYPSPRNRSVARVTLAELREAFPGWSLEARTLTLLPPVTRTPLATPLPIYRALHALPFLHSHLAVRLTAPGLPV